MLSLSPGAVRIDVHSITRLLHNVYARTEFDPAKFDRLGPETVPYGSFTLRDCSRTHANAALRASEGARRELDHRKYMALEVGAG